jgi:hypothetical protein
MVLYTMNPAMTLMEFTRDNTLMVSQYEKEGLMALSNLVPEGTLGSLESVVLYTMNPGPL